MKEIIVIVGPTGVGKTKLSIELAKRLDAEIINGDSVAIYKRLNIGSAKPTIEERENIPHHLIDIKDVDEEYSVFDYQKDVRKKIKELNDKNKRIIIVGGTGLYIKAALYNYIFTENTNKFDYSNMTTEEIIEKLKNYTEKELPHRNNRKRLENLLNKYENNEEITNFKDELLYDIKVIGLTTERNILYQRINNRVDDMMKRGLLEEVISLKEFYSKSHILNSAIGYKEFNKYFSNEPIDKVIEEIKKDSRHFAKRQYTFFNHQFQTTWFDVNFQNFNETIDSVYKYITK